MPNIPLPRDGSAEDDEGWESDELPKHMKPKKEEDEEADDA